MDFATGNEIQVTAASDAFARQLEQAKDAATNADRGNATKAAASFEKLLATMLVREMNKSLPKGFFGDGPGSDTFNGWLEEHLGGALAESSALGLTEAVRASLIQKDAGSADGDSQ